MTNSPLASATATIDVLRRHGLYTKKSLGQHLLVDDNVVGRILALAAILPEDLVVEVGPGIGTLTVALCEAAGGVVAVETDPALPAVLAETTASCRGKVAVVLADAVRVAREEIEAPLGSPSLFVSNLPYGVAATVVLRFFQLLPSLRAAVVMVQSEVAERMTASPGTKAYGAYTVKLGLLVQAAGKFRVGPKSFLPPPRVDSTVVRLERRDAPLAPPEGLRLATGVADAAFSQRRKTMRNALSSSLGVSPSAVQETLAAVSIDPTSRAESLPVVGFVTLGAALHEAGLLL